MAPDNLWRVEVRAHEDDHVEKVFCQSGIYRHIAKKIEEEISTTLDHDQFYTELVQLNPGEKKL